MKLLARLTLALTLAPAATLAQVAPGVQRNAVVGTTPEVATINTGMNLHIGGVAVSADRRYVGVNIGLQNAVLDGIDTFTSAGTATQPAGNALNGKLQFLGTSSPLLAQRTPALKSDAMSLHDAVRKLATATNSNVVLSANALKNSKVDDQAPHKIDVPAGNLREAIISLLDQTIPDVPMVVTADNEVVYVTTRAQMDVQMVSKSYSLEGLIVRLNRFVSKDTDLSHISPNDAPTPSTSSPIVLAITKNIRPEIWKSAGGKSEVTQIGNRVIINAPVSVHSLIAIPAVVAKEPEHPGYIGYTH